MCSIWDIAIWTPSFLPLYVPFELCEKFGIRFGHPPTFWDNVPRFCFFLKASPSGLEVYASGLGVYASGLGVYSVCNMVTASPVDRKYIIRRSSPIY